MSAESVAGELGRYRHMLEPLVELGSGAAELPAEERATYQAAVSTLKGYHGDHLDLEEAVAAFARARWFAPSWADPAARIAEALLKRSRHWPDAARKDAVSLAADFAQRALAIDAGSLPGRVALARVRLAEERSDEAERLASVMPSAEPQALALKSDIAESKGDLALAIRLREEQVECEREPAPLREARNKLGLLYQRAGRLDDAARTHRENLARHPDYAWGSVNLGATLEAQGDLLSAYSEVETAVLLGLDEARPFLDEIGQALDRGALERFRQVLRSGKDGEWIDLCQDLKAPAAAAGS